MADVPRRAMQSAAALVEIVGARGKHCNVSPCLAAVASGNASGIVVWTEVQPGPGISPVPLLHPKRPEGRRKARVKKRRIMA